MYKCILLLPGMHPQLWQAARVERQGCGSDTGKGGLPCLPQVLCTLELFRVPDFLFDPVVVTLFCKSL